MKHIFTSPKGIIKSQNHINNEDNISEEFIQQHPHNLANKKWYVYKGWNLFSFASHTRYPFYNSGLEPSTDSQSAQQHLQHSGEKRCVAITFHNLREALKVQPCPSFTNINKPYGFAAHSWIYVFGVRARKCKSTSSDSEPKGRPALFSLFSVSFMPWSGVYAPPKQYLHGDTHTV